jgi:hypothetical protein
VGLKTDSVVRARTTTITITTNDQGKIPAEITRYADAEKWRSLCHEQHRGCGTWPPPSPGQETGDRAADIDFWDWGS